MVTLDEIMAVADEYARLFMRAHYAPDLIHERDAKRRELQRLIERRLATKETNR